MKKTVTVCFATFSYGGNGGISSEVPDIREWMVPLISRLSKDERIASIHCFNLSDTPITMTRNRAVLMARDLRADVLVMIDSDMHPDRHVLEAGSKPFFESSFDFLLSHYDKGPVVIGSPYCGPPPKENVYVFRWLNEQSDNANPDFQLEMYDRKTASTLAGIQEVAALPTGLIMYDMRVFDMTEPKTPEDKPWFYYEWSNIFASEKASTEDVTMTRDLSLVCSQLFGYNPIFCNWDAWAGHWKPKCVEKPKIISAKDVSRKLHQAVSDGFDRNVKLVDFKNPKLQNVKFNAT